MADNSCAVSAEAASDPTSDSPAAGSPIAGSPDAVAPGSAQAGPTQARPKTGAAGGMRMVPGGLGKLMGDRVSRIHQLAIEFSTTGTVALKYMCQVQLPNVSLALALMTEEAKHAEGRAQMLQRMLCPDWNPSEDARKTAIAKAASTLENSTAELKTDLDVAKAAHEAAQKTEKDDIWQLREVLVGLGMCADEAEPLSHVAVKARNFELSMGHHVALLRHMIGEHRDRFEKDKAAATECIKALFAELSVRGVEPQKS